MLNPTKPLTAKKLQATAIFLLATAIFLLATAIFLQATAIFLQATAKKLQPNFKNSIFRARGSSRALLCAPAVSVSRNLMDVYVFCIVHSLRFYCCENYTLVVYMFGCVIYVKVKTDHK